MQLAGIDHVVIRVKDTELCLKFYQDLGCRLVKRNEAAGIYHLHCGGSTLIDLVPMDGTLGVRGGAPPDVSQGRHNMDHLCLKVDPFDKDAIYNHLQSIGVEAEDCCQRFGADGDGPSIYLKDPEGNGLELKGRLWPIDRQN
jgi:glyoxylase I family protein